MKTNWKPESVLKIAQDTERIYNNNTQVPRYLLFCEGGIYSTHVHTSVGTKLTSYIGEHRKCCLKIYFDDFANQ